MSQVELHQNGSIERCTSHTHTICIPFNSPRSLLQLSIPRNGHSFGKAELKNEQRNYVLLLACTLRSLLRRVCLSCSRLNSFGSWNNCFWKFIRKTEAQTHTHKNGNAYIGKKPKTKLCCSLFFVCVLSQKDNKRMSTTMYFCDFEYV